MPAPAKTPINTRFGITAPKKTSQTRYNAATPPSSPQQYPRPPFASKQPRPAHVRSINDYCTGATLYRSKTMNKTSVHNEPRITVDAFNRLLAQEHPFAAMLDIEVLDIGYGTAVLRLPDRSKHKRLGEIGRAHV